MLSFELTQFRSQMIDLSILYYVVEQIAFFFDQVTHDFIFAAVLSFHFKLVEFCHVLSVV